jgi:MFS family permease
MRETMLIFHFIGLTMGLGTGFAHAFLGSVVPKMTPDEATKFRLHSLVLSKMGNIGIVLLVISGFYLITPYWKELSSLPLLIVKLALVFILIILIILINLSAKKALNGDAERQFKKLKLMGKMTLIIGLSILIVAVNIFH